MPMHTPFGKTTWKVDAALIWLAAPSAAISAVTWLFGVLEGWGVTISLLFALTALPLAFISCVLFRHWRDIGGAIRGFFVPKPSGLARGLSPESQEQIKSVEIWDTMAQIQEFVTDLRKQSVEREAALGNIQRDLLVILDYCTHNVTYQMLSTVRREMPSDIEEYFEAQQITEEWIRDQTRMAKDYVSHVHMELGATRWGRDLRSLEQRAEAEGNQYVSDMPKEERPSHIDPYEFQQYAIAKTKYDLVTRFLWALEDEGQEKLGAYLESLRERLRNRTGG